MHGYDLHKQLAANLGAVWHLGLSQMYAILKEYETSGWLETIVAPQNARPARKMLNLTPAGKRAFDAWMKQSARGMREFRVDFFARLYFARAAGRLALRQFLTHQIAATRQELSFLEDTEPASAFADDVRSFRRTQLGATLKWLAAYQAEARSNSARISKSSPQTKRVRPKKIASERAI